MSIENPNYLKKWKIENDRDKKSKFYVLLSYNLKFRIISLYRIRDTWKVFYEEIYENIENYKKKDDIGLLILDIYKKTLNKLSVLDKYVDMMEDFKHIDFENIDFED